MRNRLFFAVSAITLIAVTPATAAQNRGEPLSAMSENAPVTLTGTVGEIRSDEFDLNYGTDRIVVELDRFGWTGNETKYLMPGESVTVSGFIDDDLFEGREIEAYNIQLNDSFVYYYTTTPTPTYYSFYDLEDSVNANVTGEVQAVQGSEFTIQTRNGMMTVDTSNLGYDPFDNEGLQKIDKGDRVMVYGNVDVNLYESKEIMANGLIELTPSERM